MDVLVEGVSYEPRTIKTILLIEDESAAALQLGEMFAQEADYQVIVVSDCLTALKFMRVCKPDLILLNERLLTRDGIDLSSRLSMTKDLQEIPLLLYDTNIPRIGQETDKTRVKPVLHRNVF